MQGYNPFLTIPILIAATALVAAGDSEFRNVLGQDCGGDDPRSQAICECLFDQIEERLSDEELATLTEHHRRQQAGEEISDDPDDYDMQSLMSLVAGLQGIDPMQCMGAQP